MKKSFKKKLLFLGIGAVFGLISLPHKIWATSLGAIQMELETKLIFETENKTIEVRPVQPQNIYFHAIPFWTGLSATISYDDIVEIPIYELKRVLLTTKEGTFYNLSHRTLSLRENVPPNVFSIKNRGYFYVEDLDLSKVIKCSKKQDQFECLINGTDLANIFFKKPHQKIACIMFVGKNKESLEREARERRMTTIQILNSVGASSGVRVFCLTRPVVEEKQKKETKKDKEKAVESKEEQNSI